MSAESTSIAAKIDNHPRSASQRDRILSAFEQAGADGLTRYEVEQATGLGGNSVRPAIVALKTAQLIEETSRTRPTDTGSRARVLMVSRMHRRLIFAERLGVDPADLESSTPQMIRLGWLRRDGDAVRIADAGWAVIAEGCK